MAFPTRLQHCLADTFYTLRLSAFGATAVLPLLGAASADRYLSGRRATALLGVAAAFHAFAYVHNDICDLTLDRTQPLRTTYPLVRGTLAPPAALLFALTCLPTSLALDALCAAPGRSLARRGRLIAAFGLLAAYNAWGKRCPVPPLTDFLQALGWMALLAYGAAATGQPDPPLLRSLLAYEAVLIMQVNGIHGALRDLANDCRHHARTTAIWLGARPTPCGGMHLPPALIAYALSLQLALFLIPLRALAHVAPPHRAAAAIGVSATAAFTLALFMTSAYRQPSPTNLGMLHLILILSAPLTLVAPSMTPPSRTLLLLAHTIPLGLNSMTFDALRWALRH